MPSWLIFTRRHLSSEDIVDCDYTPGKTVQFDDTVGQEASSSDSDISPTFVLDNMFNVEMQEMVRNELFQEISKEDYHHKVKLMDVIHHGQFGKIWTAQWKQENDINRVQQRLEISWLPLPALLYHAAHINAAEFGI